MLMSVIAQSSMIVIITVIIQSVVMYVRVIQDIFWPLMVLRAVIKMNAIFQMEVALISA